MSGKGRNQEKPGNGETGNLEEVVDLMNLESKIEGMRVAGIKKLTNSIAR